MGKKLTNIELRRQREVELLRAGNDALREAKRTQREAFTGHSKRKNNELLQRYIAPGLGNLRAIRDANQYVATSHNLMRQVLGLVDHVFVRYPVPSFLYRAVLREAGLQLVFDDARPDAQSECWVGEYRSWFYTAAQGGSLGKKMADTMTKREVFSFLQAPAVNTIRANLFWARCHARVIPGRVCQVLTDRLSDPRSQELIGDRMDDLLRFYANEHALMRRNDLLEITDFVSAMIEQPDFSFKSRTFNSMRQLSQDWHTWSFSGRVAVYRSWPSLIDAWQSKVQGQMVRAICLTSNRALGEEGRKQKHCVFGYTAACERGDSRIVSLRWLIGDTVEKRITVEVDMRRRKVVQIRGRLNREADIEEMKVVRMWAGSLGFTVCEWAN